VTDVPPKPRRVVLKLSGEALGPEDRLGLDMKRLGALATEVASAATRGVQVAVVVGAGNFLRGRMLTGTAVRATTADHMGMLATVLNALAMRDVLEGMGCKAIVMSAIDVGEIAERFSPRRCIKLLAEGHIAVLAGGTGNPHFTTDTAAALRAREIEADGVLKATNVDGVYSADPDHDPKAILYRSITYTECLTQNLKVMDAAAIALCRDVNLPVTVFNAGKSGNTFRALLGDDIGTRIGGS
jgi:uridylate kinase